MSTAHDPLTLRRLATRAVVASFSLAAAVAIVALLAGDMSDTGWRIVGTSVAFGILSCTTAAGTALRARPEPWAQALGGTTVAASAATFALLVVLLWIVDVHDDHDVLWRAWGIAAIVALWSSHAALLLRPLRATDSDAVRASTAVAVVGLGIDGAVGILALLGLVDDVSDAGGRALGCIGVVTVLASVVVPLLRRLAPEAGGAPDVAAEAFGARSAAARSSEDLARELTAIADRLERTGAQPDVVEQAARLRRLAVETAARV